MTCSYCFKYFTFAATYNLVVEQYVKLNSEIEIKNNCNIFNDIFFNICAILSIIFKFFSFYRYYQNTHASHCYSRDTFNAHSLSAIKFTFFCSMPKWNHPSYVLEYTGRCLYEWHTFLQVRELFLYRFTIVSIFQIFII